MNAKDLPLLQKALRALMTELRLAAPVTGDPNVALIQILRNDLDQNIHFSDPKTFVATHQGILTFIQTYAYHAPDHPFHALLQYCQQQNQTIYWSADTNVSQLSVGAGPFPSGIRTSPVKKQKSMPLTINPSEVQAWIKALERHNAAEISSAQATEVLGISHDNNSESSKVATQRALTGQISEKILEKVTFFNSISDDGMLKAPDKMLDDAVAKMFIDLTTTGTLTHQELRARAFEKFKLISPYLQEKDQIRLNQMARNGASSSSNTTPVPFFLRYLTQAARDSHSFNYEKYLNEKIFNADFDNLFEQENRRSGFGPGDLKILLAAFLSAQLHNKPAVLLTCNAAMIPQLLSRPALLAFLCTNRNFYLIIPGMLQLTPAEFESLLGLNYGNNSTLVNTDPDEKFSSGFFVGLSRQRKRVLMHAADKYIKRILNIPERAQDLSQIGLGQYTKTIAHLPALFNNNLAPTEKDRESFFLNKATGLEILFIYHGIITVPDLDLSAFKGFCDADTVFMKKYWDNLGIRLGCEVNDPFIVHQPRAAQLMAVASTQIAKTLSEASSSQHKSASSALIQSPLLKLAQMLHEEIKKESETAQDSAPILMKMADYQLSLLKNAIQLGYTPAAILEAQLTLRNISTYCEPSDLLKENDELPQQLLKQAERLTQQFGGVGALMAAYILSAVTQKLLTALVQENNHEPILDTLAYTYLRNMEIYLRVSQGLSIAQVYRPQIKDMYEEILTAIRKAREALASHMDQEEKQALSEAIDKKSAETIQSLQTEKKPLVIHNPASGAATITVSPQENITLPAHPLYQENAAVFIQNNSKITKTITRFLANIEQYYTDKIYARIPLIRGKIEFKFLPHQGQLQTDNHRTYLRIRLTAKANTPAITGLFKANFGQASGENGLALYLAKYLAECFSWRDNNQAQHAAAFFQQTPQGDIDVYIPEPENIDYDQALHHFKEKDSIFASKMDDTLGLFGTSNTTILTLRAPGEKSNDEKPLHEIIATQLLSEPFSATNSYETLKNTISKTLPIDAQEKIMHEVDDHYIAPLSPTHREEFFQLPAIANDESYVARIEKILTQANVGSTYINETQRTLNASLLASHLTMDQKGTHINPHGVRVLNVKPHLFLELAYVVLFQQQIEQLKASGQFPELASLEVTLIPRDQILLKNHSHLRLANTTAQHGHFIKLSVNFNDDAQRNIFDYFSQHEATKPFVETFKSLQSQDKNYCRQNNYTLWMQSHLRNDFYKTSGKKFAATDLTTLLTMSATASSSHVCLSNHNNDNNTATAPAPSSPNQSPYAAHKKK